MDARGRLRTIPWEWTARIPGGIVRRVNATAFDPARARHLRENANLTRKALGDRAGISPRHIQAIEFGYSRPSADALGRIADALGATIDDFYARSTSAEEARRDLAADRLADAVRKVVDQAPPLSPAQRDQIAALLRGAPRPDDHRPDAA